MDKEGKKRLNVAKSHSNLSKKLTTNTVPNICREKKKKMHLYLREDP